MSAEQDRFDWVLPATEHYSKLQHEHCVVWYDGPLTNVFRDEAGQGYILHWADAADGGNVESWLLLRVEEGVLQAWLTLTMADDWRPTFLSASAVYVVTTWRGGEVTSEKTSLDAVAAYLPGDAP